MAKGRMINRKVCVNGRIAAYGAKYGPWALVFHHRLLAFIDIGQNTIGDHRLLKAAIFPLDDGIIPEDCRNYSIGLTEFGLAQAYLSEETVYLHFPRFLDNQRGINPKKETTEYPTFTEESLLSPEQFRQLSGNLPDNFPRNRIEQNRSLTEVEVEQEGESKGETKPRVVKPEPKPIPPAAEATIKIWNAIEGTRWPKINDPAKWLISRIIAQQKQPDFDINIIITEAKKSEILLGAGWFNLGWLLKLDEKQNVINYRKVLRGDYINHATGKQPVNHSPGLCTTGNTPDKWKSKRTQTP